MKKQLLKTRFFLNLPFLDLEHFCYLLILLVKSATTCLTENKALYLCVTHGNMNYRTEQKNRFLLANYLIQLNSYMDFVLYQVLSH